MPETETHAVENCGLEARIAFVRDQAWSKNSILNILGDTELVQACAKELAQKTQRHTI